MIHLVCSLNQFSLGCPLPCHFKEYEIVDGPQTKYNSQIKIFMAMASTDILEKHEELIYPFVSFVAEFGGSLGLFIGFSFITVYDLLIGFLKSL